MNHVLILPVHGVWGGLAPELIRVSSHESEATWSSDPKLSMILWYHRGELHRFTWCYLVTGKKEKEKKKEKKRRKEKKEKKKIDIGKLTLTSKSSLALSLIPAMAIFILHGYLKIVNYLVCVARSASFDYRHLLSFMLRLLLLPDRLLLHCLVSTWSLSVNIYARE